MYKHSYTSAHKCSWNVFPVQDRPASSLWDLEVRINNRVETDSRNWLWSGMKLIKYVILYLTTVANTLHNQNITKINHSLLHLCVGRAKVFSDSIWVTIIIVVPARGLPLQPIYWTAVCSVRVQANSNPMKETPHTMQWVYKEHMLVFIHMVTWTWLILNYHLALQLM